MHVQTCLHFVDFFLTFYILYIFVEHFKVCNKNHANNKVQNVHKNTQMFH